MHVVIGGKPVGYYSHGLVPNQDRARAYHDYNQKLIQQLALQRIQRPQATPQSPSCIITRAWYPDFTGCDPENVHKGIKDALFYLSKDEKIIARLRKEPVYGDKYTYGAYYPYAVDKDSPRVEVWWADSAAGASLLAEHLMIIRADLF